MMCNLSVSFSAVNHQHIETNACKSNILNIHDEGPPCGSENFFLSSLLTERDISNVHKICPLGNYMWYEQYKNAILMTVGADT